MAKITETAAPPANRGARRFLVRGGLLYSLEAHALLRPSYNEYPSRVPLNPTFPQPGRRGGSRPAATGGAEAAPAPAPQNIFPAPRPRENRNPNGVTINPLVPAPPADSTPCPIPEGEAFIVGKAAGVAAATTETIVLGPILRPFVVTHLQLWHGAGNNADIQIFFRVAQDNNAPASLITTGVNIPTPRALNSSTDGDAFAVECYPQMHFRSGPYFFKLSVANGTAGTVDYGALVSVLYLA